MKGQWLWQRFRYALDGLLYAVRRERSFRTELLGALFAGGIIFWLHPPLLWSALLVLMVALILAIELVNTALEELLDGLHPARAEFVQRAKDCAAAAVLVLSAASVIVFVLMLLDIGISR